MPSKLYRAVLPTLVAVDDVGDFRVKSPAIGDGHKAGFRHLKEPVEMSGGDMLSYNGPIRPQGSIVEVGWGGVGWRSVDE